MKREDIDRIKWLATNRGEDSDGLIHRFVRRYELLIEFARGSRREHEAYCQAHPFMPYGSCNCGADEWNAKVDALIASVES